MLEAEEGAAFGAAILAGVGAGAWTTVEEACRKTIRVAEMIEPNADAVKLLNRQFDVYQALYPALRSAFDKG